jgi:hypothetical protein
MNNSSTLVSDKPCIATSQRALELLQEMELQSLATGKHPVRGQVKVSAQLQRARVLMGSVQSRKHLRSNIVTSDVTLHVFSSVFDNEKEVIETVLVKDGTGLISYSARRANPPNIEDNFTWRDRLIALADLALYVLRLS